MKKNYCFNSKEEQIDYIIKNYLYRSNRTSISSERVALEELLKEKTGREYSFEEKEFDITLSDIIAFVANRSEDPFWNTSLTNFFNKLNKISEAEKKRFLVEVVQNKDIFNEFTKEIAQTQNAEEAYGKYENTVRRFIAANNKK